MTATGKLGGVQASSEGDAVLLGSDGKVPSSLQATDMTLSLDPETKVLTVTVNGVSETVDLSGIGGGMKLITKEYTSYSDFYADIPSFPKGTRVLATTSEFLIDTVLNGGYKGPMYGGYQRKHARQISFESNNATITYFNEGANTGTGSSLSYDVTDITVQYWE